MGRKRDTDKRTMLRPVRSHSNMHREGRNIGTPVRRHTRRCACLEPVVRIHGHRLEGREIVVGERKVGQRGQAICCVLRRATIIDQV